MERFADGSLTGVGRIIAGVTGTVDDLVGTYSLGPLVLVRPGTSPGLIVHEQAHVRQFWRWLDCSGLVYHFSRKWRQCFEVEAYRAQLAVVGPAQAQHFALSLATKYDLAITEQEALTLLTK